jgi:diguanylate cyclase (GGDEF)-like protein
MKLASRVDSRVVERRRAAASMPLRVAVLVAVVAALFTVLSALSLMRLADSIERAEHDLNDLWTMRVSLGEAAFLMQRYGASDAPKEEDRRAAEEAWTRALDARAMFLDHNADDRSIAGELTALEHIFSTERLSMDQIWSSRDIGDAAAAKAAAMSNVLTSEMQETDQVTDSVKALRAETLLSDRQVERDWLFALLAMFSSGVLIAVGSAWVTWREAALSAIRATADHQRLRKLAFRDPLTRLANRRLLDESFERAREFADRTESGLFVAVIDLNRFKLINDRFGHHAGDHVLIEVARRLRLECGDFDTVARCGGDEFIVLLQDSQSLPEASLVAQLRAAVNRPTEYNGVLIDISASIGVARYPRDGSSLVTLTEHADQHMYHDKAASAAINDLHSRFTTTLLER